MKGRYGGKEGKTGENEESGDGENKREDKEKNIHVGRGKRVTGR